MKTVSCICCGCFRTAETICLASDWPEAGDSFITLNRCAVCVSTALIEIGGRFISLRDTGSYRHNLVDCDQKLTAKLADFFGKHKLNQVVEFIREARYSRRVEKCFVLLENISTGKISIAIQSGG